MRWTPPWLAQEKPLDQRAAEYGQADLLTTNPAREKELVPAATAHEIQSKPSSPKMNCVSHALRKQRYGPHLRPEDILFPSYRGSAPQERITSHRTGSPSMASTPRQSSLFYTPTQTVKERSNSENQHTCSTTIQQDHTSHPDPSSKTNSNNEEEEEDDTGYLADTSNTNIYALKAHALRRRRGSKVENTN